MKKTLITTAIACSAAGFAFAQETAVAQVAAQKPAVAVPSEASPVLPPMATGEAKIDEQLRALHKEMEAKIRSIREEYQKKMKVIIGERKAFVASTTQAKKEESKEAASSAMKALQQEFEAKKRALQQEFETKKRAMNNASSTEEARKALAQEFEAKMKALAQEFEAKKRALAASSTQGFRQESEMRKTDVRQEVRGTSTANPEGNAWGFFRRFFGQPKPAPAQ